MSMFPNLGVDPNQIALIASAFAAQADIFDQFAGIVENNGLKWIAQTFALIGFTYIGLFHTAWRAIVIGPWLVLLIIMTLGTSYTGGNLFFVEVDVGENTSLSSPIEPTGTYTAEEARKIEKDGDPENMGYIAGRFRKPSDNFAPDTKIHMFGPQVGLIHMLSILHRDLANALFAPMNKSLKGRLAATQALTSARTNDFRVGHFQAMFRLTCPSNPASLFAVEQQTLKNDYKDQVDIWKEQKITYANFLDMHTLFYNNQNRLADYIEADDVESFGRFVSPPLMWEGSVRKVEDKAIETGMASTDIPLAVRREMDEAERRNGNNDGVRAKIRGSQFALLKPYAEVKDNQGNVKYLFEVFADAEQRKDKYRDFQILRSGGSDESAGMDKVLNTEVELIMPYAHGGNQVSSNASFLSDRRVTNCMEFHKYLHDVTGALVEETAGINKTAAAYATEQYERCAGQNEDDEVCKKFENVSWADMDEQQKINLGWHMAKTAIKSCPRGTEIGDELRRQDRTNPLGGGTLSGLAPDYCRGNLQAKLDQLRLALISNVLRNDMPVSDGILQNAMSKNQFRSGMRQFAFDVGEKTAGPFIWLMSIFGGFAAGTYSAIMPMIIAWGIAIMIAATPFIYLMGLIIPGWSMMVALTPIIGVLYLKSVEITFILIKGIFEIFQTIIGPGILTGGGYITGTDNPTEQFYDLILGIAYTSSFALSLFLLFGLKNPAGLAQKVGTSADKTAQISGNEAMQIAGTAAVAVAAPKKAAALVGSAKTGIGKTAGALERGGFLTAEQSQGLASLGGDVGRTTRGESHQKRASLDAHAEHASDLSYEEYSKRASGQLAQSKEKEAMETAHAASNDHLLEKPQGALSKHGDNIVPEAGKLRNAFKAIADAATKAGKDIDTAAVLGTKGVGGKVNREMQRDDGTIAYDYDAAKLKGAGVDVNAIVAENDNASIIKSKGKDGKVVETLQVIEHEGYKRNSSGDSSGGGSGGASSGGNNSAARFADAYKDYSGNDDDNG